LPKEQHKWLKEQSMKTRNTDNFTSMNDIVLMALEDLRKQIS
jgi:hypothetical protein